MRRELALRLALLFFGVGTWAFGVSQIQRQAIGTYGLLASANAWFFIGLAALLGGALAEAGRRPRPRAWLMASYLAGLIVAIHATVPIVYGGIPEYAWVYKHIGVAQQFGLYGWVTDSADIYQEWPALFTTVAAVSALSGLSPLSFAAWAPLAFELADALLLLGIFRLLTTDRRLPWLAVVLYEGLAAWVGQDYLSPQAFGYLLWLGIATVIIRWLLVAPPGGARARGRRRILARVRAVLSRGSPQSPVVAPAQRLLAVALVIGLYFAVVAAHQLTPYLALMAVAGLALVGVLWRGWLLVALLALIAGGYLAPRYGMISQQFGGVFSGGNIFENASGVHGIAHRGAEAQTANIVRVLAALMWLASLAAIAIRRRTPGRVVVPAVFAFTPFLMLAAQSYGGEAIYRVFMFSAPWCSLLIAESLAGLRVTLWRQAAMSTACAVALTAGLQGLYGPVSVDAFTPAELAASEWLYDNAPPGSVLVLPVQNFPALEAADYSAYDLQVMPADPQYGADWLSEGNVTAVEQWITSLGHPSTYVVFSRSMTKYAQYFGYPVGYDRLQAIVHDRPAWQLVYRNADVVIYNVRL